MAYDANARTLRSFLDYLRVERGSAKLTIAAYAGDLTQFAEFLEKRRLALGTARLAIFSVRLLIKSTSVLA